MAIKMISGFTRFGGRIIGPKDGSVELPQETEARLVDLGVAEFVLLHDVQEENSVNEIAVGKAEPDEPAPLIPAVSLEDLTFAQLKEVADGMGIVTKGMRSKSAVLKAIEEFDKPPDPKVMME